MIEAYFCLNNKNQVFKKTITNFLKYKCIFNKIKGEYIFSFSLIKSSIFCNAFSLK